LQRRVAVKVLLPEIASESGMADRFLREARTVASLQHPHVVTVYSVRSRDGVHALVMQLVDGRGLDAVLAEGRLPLHVAGMLLAQAAEGLQHAHERGVIHRDVKPSNVLIDGAGRAVVSDFGIARREGAPRTTETGFVVGTWAYMSPEQRTADTITAATDQYAFGVMAFEVLTGRLPFEGTASEMLRAHLHQDPPSVRALRADVPAAVDALVRRMMAKDPEQRLPSLRDAERAFRTLVPDEGQTTLQLAAYSHVRRAAGSQVVAAVAGKKAPAVAAKATDAPTVRTHDAPTIRTQDAPVAPTSAPGRSRSALIGIAAGVVVLAGLWFATRDRSPAADRAAASGVPSGKGPTAGAARGETATSTPPVPSPAGGAATGGDVTANAARGARPNPAPVVERPTSRETQPASGVQPGAQPGSQSGAQSGAGAPAGGSSGTSAAIGAPAGAAPEAQPPVKPASTEPPAAGDVPAGPAATRDDARKVGREFVTMLNQRRYRELGQLPAIGGDAAARAELLKLAETAAEFSAGFDRLPSAPASWARGFDTDFEVDVQWRGGRKLFRVHVYASPGDGVWRIAGIAVEPAG
jgi:serine/threonine-protein kinase